MITQTRRDKSASWVLTDLEWEALKRTLRSSCSWLSVSKRSLNWALGNCLKVRLKKSSRTMTKGFTTWIFTETFSARSRDMTTDILPITSLTRKRRFKISLCRMKNLTKWVGLWSSNWKTYWTKSARNAQTLRLHVLITVQSVKAALLEWTTTAPGLTIVWVTTTKSSSCNSWFTCSLEVLTLSSKLDTSPLSVWIQTAISLVISQNRLSQLRPCSLAFCSACL